MIRVAVTMLGLAAWLAAALGLRAWLGGKAYLARILGSEVLAEQTFDRALDQPEAILLGMDPWMLLLAFSVAVSAGLVLGVLTPCDLLLRRFGASPRIRMLAGAVLGAVAAGVALESIHPLLSLPSVPEGPRTVLNYACEAAGYGWVNAIAYLGAIGAGITLTGWSMLDPTAAGAAASVSPTTDQAPAEASDAERSAERSAEPPAPAPAEPDASDDERSAEPPAPALVEPDASD